MVGLGSDVDGVGERIFGSSKNAKKTPDSIFLPEVGRGTSLCAPSVW